MKQKSLIKNSIYNMIYKGLNVLFPLITVTYVSRILLASGVGKVSYAQNIVQYFVMLASLGIPNYGIREISKNQNDAYKLNKIFNELFIINFISSIFFAICYYTMISTSQIFARNYVLHVVVGISIVLNIINVDWFYQGVEEYGYIVFRSFLVKIFSLILIVVFIRKPSDFLIYAVINCLAVGGNSICNIIHLKKYKIKLYFNNLNLKVHIKPILILMASVISIELYTLLDVTMVGIFCGEENVGYYTNSLKLVKMLITLINGMAGVLLPRLSYYHNIGDEESCSEIVSNVFVVMFFIFIPCEIGIFLLADEIVLILFGASFAPAGITLKIASFLICTLGFSNLFGTQILLTYEKEKLLLITTIVGAVSNIIMNLILIPLWQQNGAAIASVISEGFVTIISIYFACKNIKLILKKECLIKTFISSILMTIILIYLKNIIFNIYVLVFISIFSCFILYIFSNILLKNSILKNFLEILNKKRNNN